MNNSNDILEQEIIKIRSNKILGEYLRDSRQYLWYNYLTSEIEFREIRELTIAYQTGKDKSWGIIQEPIIPQHPAQQSNLSQ
jgi:hypothetical protein